MLNAHQLHLKNSKRVIVSCNMVFSENQVVTPTSIKVNTPIQVSIPSTQSLQVPSILPITLDETHIEGIDDTTLEDNAVVNESDALDLNDPTINLEDTVQLEESNASQAPNQTTTSAKSAQRCKHKLPYKFQFPSTKRQPKANPKYADHATTTTETEESDTYITPSTFHEAISLNDVAQ